MHVIRFRCPQCGNSIENRLHVKVAVQSWCNRDHSKMVRMVEEPVIPEERTDGR